MFFLVLGAVSATDSLNVSNTEDSNLIEDNVVDSLSTQDKLEVSNEDSISETNIVISHDDDLGDYSYSDDVLNSSVSDDEDNLNDQLTSNDVVQDDNNALSSAGSSDDSVIAVSSSDNDVVADSSTNSGVVSASTKTSTVLSVSDTHYDKSATYFKLTLKDKSGKTLAKQKVSLKVKNKVYSAVTNNKGIALVKTASLAVGTYTVTLNYAGSSKYSSSSLSKKVKVSSSVNGSDLTKYYGYVSQYKAKFWKDNDALANTKISFKINGKTYTRTTDKNGVAKLNINLAVGKYVLTTTNPYSKEKSSNNVVVKKDKTTVKHGSNVTYIIPGKLYYFGVTLKSKHGVLINNQKVKFTYDGKTVTAKTNKNGKAVITIPVLAKGTYKIYYKFAGNKNYLTRTSHSTLIVKDPTTKVSASTLKMKYNDGSKFKVKLTSSAGKALVNKKIKFKLNGITSYVKTNSKGVAKLAINDLKVGTYKIVYSYSTKGLKNFSYGRDKVVITRAPTTLTLVNLVMKYKDGSSYKVLVKDKSGHRLKNVTVKFTLDGKTYLKTTNSRGVASLKVTKEIGYYTMKTVLKDPCYKSSKFTKHVLVNGTKFIASNKYYAVGHNVKYSIKLIDGKNLPIKNSNVKFTFKGKAHHKKTNSKGVLELNLGKLAKGNYALRYSHDSFSGLSKIYVVRLVSINQVITASAILKEYIEEKHKIPSTITVNGVKYNPARYVYLAAKSIDLLKSGKSVNSKLFVKTMREPTSPKEAKYLGDLYDYRPVAKTLIKVDKTATKVMPNSVSSKVGTIGYKGVVYAFSRVLTYYGENADMPAYVTIKTLDSTSVSNSKLNSHNTIKNLAAYLAASTNCQVDNAKIKQLVAKITKNCVTEKQKATAIFNYVRDTISYSFYYDTKYGALGTLNAGTGNCVDHSHVLVAMFRTADLPARYVHGTCTFSSGSTYGHVWTQVLIGDTWTVADATSSRNSFGNVVNWNENSYSLNGYYASLSF